jgi:hypothetical protein
MPIVFHFKDRQDPRDTQLLPEEHERLASPLIIRPVAVGKPDAVRYRAMALILKDPARPGQRLRLDGYRGNEPIRAELSPQEARQIRPLNGEPDVLKAFSSYFASRLAD